MPVRTHCRSRVASRLVSTAVIGAGLLLSTLPFAAGAGASATAQARKHLLVLADMPKGWSTEKGTGGSGSSNNFPGASQLASCIGVPAALITANPPEANSPYYENKAGSLEVQDQVSVFPSVKNARAQYAAIANAKTPMCLAAIVNGQAFKSQLAGSSGEGAVIGTITVTKVGQGNYAPGTTTLDLTIPITDQGVQITAKLAVVFSIKGTLGQQVSFNSYNATFPASLSRRLTALAQSRL